MSGYVHVRYRSGYVSADVIELTPEVRYFAAKLQEYGLVLWADRDFRFYVGLKPKDGLFLGLWVGHDFFYKVEDFEMPRLRMRLEQMRRIDGAEVHTAMLDEAR